jgi:hypothetical protein
MGFRCVTVLRPGFISGRGTEDRLVESLFGVLTHALGPVLRRAYGATPRRKSQERLWTPSYEAKTGSIRKNSKELSLGPAPQNCTM